MSNVFWNSGAPTAPYLNKLLTVSNKVELGLDPTLGINNDIGSQGDQYFTGYLMVQASYGFPTTWDALATGWRNYQNSYGRDTQQTGTGITFNTGYSAGNGIGPSISSSSSLYQNLLNSWLEATGNSVSDSGAISSLSGDWSILNDSSQSPSVLANQNFLSTSPANNAFIATFNAFLSSLNPSTLNLGPSFPIINGAASNTFVLTNFVNDWKDFIATTCTMQPSANSTQPAAFADLPSYYSMYQAFGPNISYADFENRLKSFYTARQSYWGYFLPSLFIGEWITTMHSQNTAVLGSSTLSGNHSEKILIISQILFLIIQLIKALQDVAVAQSNKLQYYTKFENAYTALQNQIPTFLVGSPGKIGGNSQSAETARGNINSAFNANLSSNLRNLQNIQQNNAKTFQTNVNQTSDAVNQQTDTVTSFIQQMSSLLSAIIH